MQKQDHNNAGEWTPSPLQLLAGCATFPFSLVYSKWKKNEEVEPYIEPRNKKNIRHNDRDVQHRKQQHGAARPKPAPNPERQRRKPQVLKERGGRESNSPRKSPHSQGTHYQEKSPNVSRKSQRSPREVHVRTSTPVKNNQDKNHTYSRNVPQTPCCNSAEDRKEVCPNVGKKTGGGLKSDNSSFNKNSMCRDCIDKYERGIELNYVRNLTILWFPPNFSQSQFGDRNAGSNACTLIAILVSYKCHKTGLKLPNIRMQEAWEPLMNILAESIVEGNSIHERLRKDKKLVDYNLTVPEAMDATRRHVQKVIEWESDIVTSRMKTSLFDFLSNKVMQWYMTDLSLKGSDLYVIVVSVKRSVVVIFQRESETVTLVDSHTHYPHGAAIAQVPFKKLRELCNWYACILNDSAQKPIQQYELSYLYFV